MEQFFQHASAIVDDGATIGKATRIWHFCHVMPKAIIGTNCILGQNVFVDNSVVIGDGVKIQNNVSVYNGVIIEDDVFIGPSVVFTNVINPRSFIERKQEFRQTVVKKGASIGANSTLVCGIEIGEYAFIGAGSVVTRNVPPYSLVYGNPAQHRGWMSRQGHVLRFKNAKATCPESGEKYLLEGNRVQPA
ncbi:N-acetyltransferase [Flavisolibacter sp. BT320]|nr:N-acetyltransferase [Flavisolibacter longurius]